MKQDSLLLILACRLLRHFFQLLCTTVNQNSHEVMELCTLKYQLNLKSRQKDWQKGGLKHTHTHKHKHTHKHTHTNTNTHTNTHTHKRTHTNTHTQTHKHTHTQTNTQTHTHTRCSIEQFCNVFCIEILYFMLIFNCYEVTMILYA
jgi:ABC-type nickel/cobalt efflux system permease component RcnA